MLVSSGINIKNKESKIYHQISLLEKVKKSLSHQYLWQMSNASQHIFNSKESSQLCHSSGEINVEKDMT